jgi:hypothetical protein
LPCYGSPVPDDEGRRRRLGDETKNRIADLASGWSLDDSDPPPAAPAHTPKPAQAPPAHTPTPKPAPPTARSGPTPAPPPGDARSKPRTNPPPPPGSAERKALEDKIVDTARAGIPRPTTGSSTSNRITSATVSSVAGEARGKPPSQPPDSSGVRSGPQFRRAGYAGPDAPFATEGRTFTSEPHTPAVIVDESLSGPIAIAAAPSNPIGAEPSRPRPNPAADRQPLAMPLPAPNASSIPGLAVPVGEFDSGVRTIEQSTLRRDAADALLGTPERRMSSVAELDEDDLVDDDDDDSSVDGQRTRSDFAGDSSASRGDPTIIDPQTAKFERGDPTQDSSLAIPDATSIQRPSGRLSSLSGGTLRPSAALRRKRGLLGDVRYVFTALFGVRRSRRELVELEHRQSLRQTSRRRHLVTLGRTAVSTDTFDHPALGKAREQMQAIEDERSRHAGAVSASDAELERVRRDRATKAKQYIEALGATDTELAELTKKLEPLEKEALAARRRGQELRESLQRIEKKIADTEALLTSVKGEKLDKAAVLADIATYKADRQAILRDEPTIAAELDALNPRIAAMEGTRAELRRKRTELEKAEKDDQRRTSELLEAIGAKRKVVERGAQDAETARDTALFELGDRLYVDRPGVLAAQLSPIDQIDLELGEGDRRIMELREILSNIDKAKFARGTAMIILVLAAVGSFVAWLLYALL